MRKLLAIMLAGLCVAFFAPRDASAAAAGALAAGKVPIAQEAGVVEKARRRYRRWRRGRRFRFRFGYYPRRYRWRRYYYPRFYGHYYPRYRFYYPRRRYYRYRRYW